jgi:hypothetical protein
MTRLTKAQKAARLARDARNRAVRSFLQGLALDVLVAVALVVRDATNGNDGGVDYRLLGLSLAKTVLQSCASYVMRRLVDPSAVPTPLPPAEAGEPDEDDPQG